MDLLKQNIENAAALSSRNIKSVVNERVKHTIKPLADVKNILGDKSCLTQRINKKEALAEVYKKEDPEEFDDPLYYFEDNYEDDYRDVIPWSLQLTADDLKCLNRVFDVPHYKEDPKKTLEPLLLPEVPVYFDKEDSFLSSYKDMIEMESLFVI